MVNLESHSLYFYPLPLLLHSKPHHISPSKFPTATIIQSKSLPFIFQTPQELSSPPPPLSLSLSPFLFIYPYTQKSPTLSDSQCLTSEHAPLSLIPSIAEYTTPVSLTLPIYSHLTYP